MTIKDFLFLSLFSTELILVRTLKRRSIETRRAVIEQSAARQSKLDGEILSGVPPAPERERRAGVRSDSAPARSVCEWDKGASAEHEPLEIIMCSARLMSERSMTYLMSRLGFHSLLQTPPKYSRTFVDIFLPFEQQTKVPNLRNANSSGSPKKKTRQTARGEE